MSASLPIYLLPATASIHQDRPDRQRKISGDVISLLKAPVDQEVGGGEQGFRALGFPARINLLPLLRFFSHIFQQPGKENEECAIGLKKEKNVQAP